MDDRRGPSAMIWRRLGWNPGRALWRNRRFLSHWPARMPSRCGVPYSRFGSEDCCRAWEQWTFRGWPGPCLGPERLHCGACEGSCRRVPSSMLHAIAGISSRPALRHPTSQPRFHRSSRLSATSLRSTHAIQFDRQPVWDVHPYPACAASSAVRRRPDSNPRNDVSSRRVRRCASEP